MQSVRQSLLTICICLYAFLAVTLGLSFLVGRADESAASGFYHPELSFPFEAIDGSSEEDVSPRLVAPALSLIEDQDTVLAQR